MLDEVLYLTPDDLGGPSLDTNNAPLPTSSEPPIFIPGIGPDGRFFAVEKIRAHREGIHHLALSIFVFDGEELLIQRRADHKYHCGGQWANTCCTHPHLGEDAETAAKRRLQEELGFSIPVEEKLVVEYSADVGNGLWERERVHMFCAKASKKTLHVLPNPEEVSETRWISAAELHQEIQKNPNNFTPWFRIYLKRFPDLTF